MAYFDLYGNPGDETRRLAPYLLDVQSTHVGILPTRIVIPLRPTLDLGFSGKPSDLLPVFEINGEKDFLDTPAMSAVPLNALGMCSHVPRRDKALAIIHDELARARQAIERQGHTVTVATASGRNEGDNVKLTVSSAEAQVKVEVNYVFRGTLTPTVTRSVVPRAQLMFRVDFEVPTLSFTAANSLRHWTGSIRAIFLMCSTCMTVMVCARTS
jgi:hypothetical protein